MEAKLIHIECGIFNGIANYKIGDKILRFELGTPYYNDYEEFRVSAPFDFYFKSDYDRLKILDYNEKYEGHKPTNLETSIELSEYDVKWWLNTEPIKSDKEWQVSGGVDKDNNFVIWVNGTLIKYSDWINESHDSYEHFMYQILNVFYHWYMSDDCNPTDDLMIFSEL